MKKILYFGLIVPALLFTTSIQMAFANTLFISPVHPSFGNAPLRMVEGDVVSMQLVNAITRIMYNQFSRSEFPSKIVILVDGDEQAASYFARRISQFIYDRKVGLSPGEQMIENPKILGMPEVDFKESDLKVGHDTLVFALIEPSEAFYANSTSEELIRRISVSTAERILTAQARIDALGVNAQIYVDISTSNDESRRPISESTFDIIASVTPPDTLIVTHNKNVSSPVTSDYLTLIEDCSSKF